MSEHEEWKKHLESRKFHWMNFGLIGIGASIALLVYIENNLFIFLALVLFALIVIFEAVGLRIIERKNAYLGKNPWYVKLWFFNSTFWDIVLLVIALILLGLGVYMK